MIYRFLTNRLPDASARHLVMITGARQTGKTTLARAVYPNLRYISLDEVEARLQLRQLPTRAWANTVGAAVLDEAQKEPAIFEKVKFAYDQGEIDFSVLLGSSQITMLKKVRETLAGRVFIYELWPLLLSELTGGSAPQPPLFERLLALPGTADEILTQEPAILLGEEANHQAEWLKYALAWGSMPGLLPLNQADRHDWLRSYTNTYLERDLADLARLDDLLPFRRFLQLAALRSGQLLSYADLARDTAVSPTTARNYLHYLTLSYQAFLLQPWFGNQTKRLVKSPKLYWTDVGLYRQQTGNWGEVNGPLWETFVVGECYKWIKTMRPDTNIWFYRTHGGLEVDVLLESEHGMWGIEIKASRQASRGQTRSLRRLGKQMGGQWRGGLLVYQGEQIVKLGENIWAVPVGRLFG